MADLLELNFQLQKSIVDKNGIILDKTNLEKIINKIFQDTEKITKEEILKESNPLKSAAQDYILNLQLLLKDINSLRNNYQQTQSILENFNKQDSFYAQEYANAVIERNNNLNFKEIYQKIIILTDNFTRKVQNTISNKKYEIAYVYQSRAGNVVEIYKINKVEDLIKLRKTSSGGIEQRLSASKKHLQQLGKVAVKRQDYTIGLQQAKLLDIVYKQVIQRYNKKKGMPKLILWNVGSSSFPSWHKMFLYQKGDLAQTYANFALTKYNTSFIGNVNNPPQTDIELFMLEVQTVDATFGGVQTDIFNKITNTGYAVKTLQAAPQGVMKTIDMAKDFMTGEWNPNNFKEYQEKMKKDGRNIIEEITIKQAETLLSNLTK